MKNLLDFFINIGRLKKKKRKGWVVHRVRNPETTASHTFRMAMLSWVLGRGERLNMEKVIKMALVHDICEVFTFDETPYDPLLPKKVDSPEGRRKAKEVLSKWPKFSLNQKKKKVDSKHKRELRALEKLISKLPPDLKNELKELWLDFEEGRSKEGRFVHQVDKAENFLQGMEYWKQHKGIQKDLWVRWAKETFSAPVLIEFEKVLENRFFGDRKATKKNS